MERGPGWLLLGVGLLLRLWFFERFVGRALGGSGGGEFRVTGFGWKWEGLVRGLRLRPAGFGVPSRTRVSRHS